MKKVIAIAVLLLILVCLGQMVQGHQTHQTENMPRWTGFLLLGVLLLTIWPHLKKDEELF